jgi:SAM-dependent methyltransferase
MKSGSDAYGHEIFDYNQGEKVLEIVELYDGYIDATGSPQMYFADYDDWPDYEKESMTHVEGKVLDIGCGAGRHCLYLQGKGHDVLGIDTSPLAIKICKLRGVKKPRL